jgi:hypothetical protein
VICAAFARASPTICWIAAFTAGLVCNCRPTVPPGPGAGAFFAIVTCDMSDLSLQGSCRGVRGLTWTGTFPVAIC